MSTTLRSIGDAVITTDRQSKVTFINDAAQSLTEWSESDAVGKSVTDIFNIINEQIRSEVELPIDDVLCKGIVVSLADDIMLITKSGQEIYIDDSYAPIKDDSGYVIGSVIVFRDIRERKKAEKEKINLERQLLQTQKMEAVGTLASGIAHDFNNMVSVILGSAELAKHEIPEKHRA